MRRRRHFSGSRRAENPLRPPVRASFRGRRGPEGPCAACYKPAADVDRVALRPDPGPDRDRAGHAHAHLRDLAHAVAALRRADRQSRSVDRHLPLPDAAAAPELPLADAADRRLRLGAVHLQPAGRRQRAGGDAQRRARPGRAGAAGDRGRDRRHPDGLRARALLPADVLPRLQGPRVRRPQRLHGPAAARGRLHHGRLRRHRLRPRARALGRPRRAARARQPQAEGAGDDDRRARAAGDHRGRPARDPGQRQPPAARRRHRPAAAALLRALQRRPRQGRAAHRRALARAARALPARAHPPAAGGERPPVPRAAGRRGAQPPRRAAPAAPQPA